MISSSHLDRAVAQAIISSEQASALRKLARYEQDNQAGAENTTDIDFAVASEDEPFRLLKGFRDFFIAIGIVILAIGLSMLADEAFRLVIDGKLGWRGSETPTWTTAVTMGVLIIISLAIGEWVTKSQRLPLSSLVLTLVFALWCGLFSGAAFYSLASIFTGNESGVLALVPHVGILGSILALIFYYKRYRLPFVLLPLAGAAILGVVLVFSAIVDLDNSPVLTRMIIGISGIAVFVAAMLFDIKDPLRRTRLSECAFWLHLLAAPLMVHSLLYDSIRAEINSITIVLVVAVLAVFALIIDRRAILVSALIYLGFSLFTIIKDIQFFGEFNNSASLVLLGAMVLGLGLGWAQIRRFLVSHLVWQSLRNKLPPVDG